MRFLFIADVPPDPDSGAAGTDYQMVEALKSLGHEVDAIWGDSLSRRISHGNLHYLLELPFTYEWAMLSALRRKQYDVIHISQPHGYRAARSLAGFRPRPIFIHQSHGFEMRAEDDLRPWVAKYGSDRRSPARKVLSAVLTHALRHNSKSIARYADGQIVLTSQCKEYLHQKLGVPAERIAVIPLAPPPYFLAGAAPPMTADRLNRILYVSQFAFVKAPMIVAEIMNELAYSDEKLSFTWVCSRQHHNSVRRLLGEDTISRVKLLDWMSQGELRSTYDEHGIFLFPSFFEGFGKVFVEAMSRGLCVIAADNSGAHDVVTSGRDGILVPTGESVAMVSECLKLVGDLARAMRMSQNAGLTARGYTWERVAQEMVAFCKNRLEAEAPRR
jgi:glycosyltransferase involved in cell wall biosynthesis